MAKLTGDEAGVIPGTNIMTYRIPMTPELTKMMREARAEWKRLEKAGTPYWCIHKNRDVTSLRAQWKLDYPQDPDPIHRKHGVICLDCGGYIQEG